MITLKSKNNLPLLGHRAIRKKEEKKNNEVAIVAIKKKILRVKRKK